MKVFNFYHDAGHGWLSIPYVLLVELGIQNKISYYSYKKGNYVYLEEDLDASIFHDAMESSGNKYDVRHVYGEDESPIRNYESYMVQPSV